MTPFLRFLLRVICWPGYIPVAGRTGFLDQFATFGVKTRNSTHGATVIFSRMQRREALHYLFLAVALRRYVEARKELCRLSQVVDVVPKRVEWDLLACRVYEAP